MQIKKISSFCIFFYAMLSLGLVLIEMPCSASYLCMTEFGFLIPKEIFFKVAENIVPNLLKPIHPKEIAFQDTQLKSYRRVCKRWRELLDQRINFQYAMKLFVIDNGWPYGKCLNNLCLRWNKLKVSYYKKEENEWLVDQTEQKRAIKKRRLNSEYGNEVKTSKNLEETVENYSVRFNQCFKSMKSKLKSFDPAGLLMLQNYVHNKGFLSTSLTRCICNFYVQFKDKDQDLLKYNLLKILASVSNSTNILAFLFNKLVFYIFNDPFLLLKESKIDYPLFLNKIYWSFLKRIEQYKGLLLFERIQQFFIDYKECFALKDDRNKLFLYYLLLYSKDAFFEIQTILLAHFIKSTEKELVNYQEDQQLEYQELFEKNFLNRLGKFSKDEKVLNQLGKFLKEYFGYSV